MISNSFLKVYATTLTVVLAFVAIYIINLETNTRFDEITVQRINVVEPDGKLKMVISNTEKQHPGMFDGEILSDRKRPPGFIFFNEAQDEVGGLVYEGNKTNGAGMALSIDQFKNDQILQMQYLRNKEGKQKYGLNVWDRAENITQPQLIAMYESLKSKGVENSYEVALDSLKKMNNNHPVSAERLFAGKTYKNQVGLFIKDDLGHERIRICVDENNKPKFQILDENGAVIKDFVYHAVE